MKTLTNGTMEKSHQKKHVFSLSIGLEQQPKKLVVQSASHFDRESSKKQGVSYHNRSDDLTMDGSEDHKIKPEHLLEDYLIII